MKTTLGFLTEEGRTRSKNAARRISAYAVVMFLVAGAGGYAIYRYWVANSLTTLQRIYFKQYFKSTYRSYLSNSKSHYTTLARVVTDPSTKKDVSLAVVDDEIEPQLDENGRMKLDKRHYPIILLKAGIDHKQFLWQETMTPDSTAYQWFRNTIYEGESIPLIWRPAWLGGLLIFFVGIVGLTSVDSFAQRRYLKGEAIRGTRDLSPKQYERQHQKADSYGVRAYVDGGNDDGKLRRLVGLEPRSYMLRVPREEENEGLLLLGDPGTGKSQVIHQLLDQIAQRRPSEAVVCYDPAGEFIESHFDPSTDIVLNPLDARAPYWSPTMEIDYETTATSATDRQLVAESFFSNREHGAPTTEFFVKAARSIFARMLELKPTAEQIVEFLKDEKLIDEVVAGTEHAHLINEGAKGQRGGVLATLSEIGEALKLLPSPEQCDGEMSITEWARRRRGWIFITSTQDTRDALRTLHAAWINILMKRLLAVAPQLGRQHPCWVVVDEVHSLKRLPALATTMVEGRKFGLKMILGTQNKAQFEEHYGRGAATMLSAPHVKILFRCNEPESARWVAEMIGEEEKERPRIGTTATVQSNGRDSINYSTITERRFVVSKEEIMALPNLSGYWKYSNSVVRFHIQPVDRRRVALAFMRRNAQSLTEPQRPTPPAIEQPADCQLALPLVEITQPTYSNDSHQEEEAISQELTPEVNAGPSFNF